MASDYIFFERLVCTKCNVKTLPLEVFSMLGTQKPVLKISPELRLPMEGDIGVCGIAVLANFSCGISVILILNCGIAVFSKPAGCVFFTFWSTIFGIKTYPSLFSDHL